MEFLKKNLIRRSLIDSYLNTNEFTLDRSNLKKRTLDSKMMKELERTEIYYSTRILQINTDICSNLITDLIEVIITLLIKYFLNIHFEGIDNKYTFLLFQLNNTLYWKFLLLIIYRSIILLEVVIEMPRILK